MISAVLSFWPCPICACSIAAALSGCRGACREWCGAAPMQRAAQTRSPHKRVVMVENAPQCRSVPECKDRGAGRRTLLRFVVLASGFLKFSELGPGLGHFDQ